MAVSQNRLAQETSPYLLQHAGNPVDWFPWGPDALAAARERDVPIFLSIGYSACHWCHVMEHESFENEAIAGLMNEHFVNVKVDREERPDLDQIYMNAVIALSGRGGWPMSVFLTPDLKPFFGGTYWPPESRMGMPGFRDILTKVAAAWESQREQVHASAQQLTDAVAGMGGPHGDRSTPAESLLQNAMHALIRAADRVHGGFGQAPKFPHSMDLRVLLRCWKRFGDPDGLSVLQLTLDKMSQGGIYDHLGGGFHRYSTDGQWLVPHFEKMLYDNALLAPVYLESFQATGCDDHARVARETLDYVLREMTSPEGGFYSTQDADSEGEEGRFFVWSENEIVELLGNEDARLFEYCYDVTPRGNWEGRTILNRPKPHDEAAKMLGVSESDLAETLNRCKAKLFEARAQRVAPGRDDKVLVSWNGLMISAMCRGAQVLGDDRYATAARNAADFLLENLRDADGRLLHAWKDGRARFNGYLDDYACLIDGLIDLYETRFEAKDLASAVELADAMIARFGDPDGGGFFYTSDDHERLIARYKDTQDNATPSGNATAALALLRLARLTTESRYEEAAVKTLELLAGQLEQHPLSGGQGLLAVDFLLGPTQEIVLSAPPDSDATPDILAVLRRSFRPNAVIALRPDVSDDELPSPLKGLLTGKRSPSAELALYLCERGLCHAPVIGVEAIREALSAET